MAGGFCNFCEKSAKDGKTLGAEHQRSVLYFRLADAEQDPGILLQLQVMPGQEVRKPCPVPGIPQGQPLQPQLLVRGP